MKIFFAFLALAAAPAFSQGLFLESVKAGAPPQPSLWQKCRGIFQSGKGQTAIPLSEFQSPAARAAHQSLYARAEAIKGLLPKKSRRELMPFLEGLMRLLDSAAAKPKIKKHIGYLPHFESALQKAPDMIQFLESHKGRPEDSLNREIFQAVLASFTKHVPAYLADNQPALLDWPRINRILEAVSGFDKESGYVSFFRIKEAVEEAYSLKEYICCKTD